MHAAPPSPNAYIRQTEDRIRSAKALAQIARQTGGNIKTERLRMRHTAADCITLRGVPAIGPGVAGVIWQTSPGHGLFNG